MPWLFKEWLRYKKTTNNITASRSFGGWMTELGPKMRSQLVPPVHRLSLVVSQFPCSCLVARKVQFCVVTLVVITLVTRKERSPLPATKEPRSNTVPQGQQERDPVPRRVHACRDSDPPTPPQLSSCTCPPPCRDR